MIFLICARRKTNILHICVPA